MGVLLLVQLAVSPIAKDLLNRKLDQMTGYVGRVAGLRIMLWRGTFEVRDFSMLERGHDEGRPLLFIKKATVIFAPGALLQGRLVGRVVVEGGEINFIKRQMFESACASPGKTDTR